MISPRCFTPEWSRAKAREIRAGDPALLGKAVHALALLGHLAESGLDFVFKGGTSLLLHAGTIRRLSIDIDILCPAPPGELDKVLPEIGKKAPFTGWAPVDRGERGLPERRHFRFLYPSGFSGGGSVLLDVVEEPDVPHVVVSKPIVTSFLEIDREVMVRVASIESLLADKLCAFAPRTTGVRFEPPNGRPTDTMQIVKQLFDVGELFDMAESLADVRAVYRKVFDLENGYRGGRFTMSEALKDTETVSLRLGSHKLKGVADHPDALLLVDGIGRLASHLVNHRFHLDDARRAASRAGLMTRLIDRESSGDSLSIFREMPGVDDLRKMKVDGEMEPINRLKAINPEAFYRWYQASRL